MMPFRCVALLALMLLGAGPALARTIEVGAGAGVRDPGQVPWDTLQPGDRVLLRAGTYAGPIVITAKGALGAPIVIEGAGREATIVKASIVLEGAQHVVVRNLTVRKASYPGIIVRNGAAFTTVDGVTVEHSGLGYWIGDGAGAGHKLLNSTMRDNKTHGAAIDVINAAPGQETLIAGNLIERNGYHGIELNGNHYIIEGNRVRDNGLLLSGTSGIHVYAKDPGQDAGKHNVIRFNQVSGQKETDGQDGNGIQLDQWCDDNAVYFNVAWGNDGAGIAIFDAAHNRVFNNTLTENMLDSGGKHAYKAELVVASDYTKKVDHAHGNILRNNLLVTRRSGVVPIYVDPYASRNTTEIAGEQPVPPDAWRLICLGPHARHRPCSLERPETGCAGHQLRSAMAAGEWPGRWDAVRVAARIGTDARRPGRAGAGGPGLYGPNVDHHAGRCVCSAVIGHADWHRCARPAREISGYPDMAGRSAGRSGRSRSRAHLHSLFPSARRYPAAVCGAQFRASAHSRRWRRCALAAVLAVGRARAPA